MTCFQSMNIFFKTMNICKIPEHLLIFWIFPEFVIIFWMHEHIFKYHQIMIFFKCQLFFCNKKSKLIGPTHFRIIVSYRGNSLLMAMNITPKIKDLSCVLSMSVYSSGIAHTHSYMGHPICGRVSCFFFQCYFFSVLLYLFSFPSLGFHIFV